MSIYEDAKNTLRELRDEVRATGKPLSEEQRKKEAEALEQIEAYQTEQRLNQAVSDFEKRDAEIKEAEYREASKAMPKEEAKDDYADEFRNWLAGRTPYLRTVTDNQNKGVDADGGYLAPNEFYAKIVSGRDAVATVRKHATVLNISNSMNIPVAGSDVTVGWQAEGAANTLTKQAFALKTLELRKLTATVGITEELMADTPINIENWIVNRIGIKMALEEDNAFINGTAANNAPVGILQSGITSMRTANSSAVTADEVYTFFGTLPVQYQKFGTWIISPAFRTALMNMATNGNYLWQPSGRDGVPDMILGRPVEVSDNIGDSLGSDKFLAVFGDLSYYYIGDKQGLNVSKYDTRFDDGTWKIRVLERTSGVLTDNNAVKVLQCKH